MSKELDDRFLGYALHIRNFCGSLRKERPNWSYISQLMRASASIGANYIEASDPLGKADELMKLKISRREAKESAYWLKLIVVNADNKLEDERNYLISETEQITKILSAIIIELTT